MPKLKTKQTQPLTPQREQRGIEKLTGRVIQLDNQLKEAIKLLSQNNISIPDSLTTNGNQTANIKKKKPKRSKKMTTSPKRTVKLSNTKLYEFGKKQTTQNVITRQLTKTAIELDKFDKITPLTKARYKFKRNEIGFCYGCNRPCSSFHPVYVYSCHKCGELFQENRYLTRDLSNTVSLVIGCRTKLGHQVTLKLLRAGSTVIGTTRYPQETLQLFSQYEDFNSFKDRLVLYEKGLDLDTPNMEHDFTELRNFIDQKYGVLHHMIFCAAQTIRVREKERDKVKNQMEETNRYGDAKFVDEKNVNSWQMTIDDMNQQEIQECSTINAIAPCMMTKVMLPLMRKSTIEPYIIFVHAREGLFNVNKSKFHMHTNMAKAGLAMLTLCLNQSKLKTNNGMDFAIHGCDPGWISVDEYYEDTRPWEIPPLDERDGAARILYPLFKQLKSNSKTRRHFIQLTY